MWQSLKDHCISLAVHLLAFGREGNMHWQEPVCAARFPTLLSWCWVDWNVSTRSTVNVNWFYFSFPVSLGHTQVGKHWSIVARKTWVFDWSFLVWIVSFSNATLNDYGLNMTERKCHWPGSCTEGSPSWTCLWSQARKRGDVCSCSRACGVAVEYFVSGQAWGVVWHFTPLSYICGCENNLISTGGVGMRGAIGSRNHGVEASTSRGHRTPRKNQRWIATKFSDFWSREKANREASGKHLVLAI